MDSKAVRGVVLVAVLMLGLPGAAFGAREFEKVGTQGGQFLKIGIGARAAGMGAAFTSIADDASAVYWNPAGVARITRNVIALNHCDWAADISFSHAAYVFDPKYVPGMMAIHARSLYMPEQVVRTVYKPEGDGTKFDNGDVGVGITYARSLTDKFSAGLTFNYIHSSLADYSASAYTFDFGTLYDTGYQSLRIGMAIQNIGSDMEFITKSVKMPTVFRVGMSMSVYESEVYSALTSAEFSHPPDNNERANIGMEVGYKDFIRLRGGYGFGYDADGLGLGFGFKVPTSLNAEATMDYAFTDMSELGGIHRIAVDFRF
ncbi:MAG: PorV/PorQ family protein [Candidatus Eisenbacteria sp.]|nr:PorV/PorQ family protein [Candidatus Eisenbacteria bacterium]